MPESSNNDPAKSQNKALDLSELQNLSFGPNWSERKESHTGGGRTPHGHTGGSDRRSGGGRDRRPPRREQRSGERPTGDGRSFGGGQQRGDRPARPQGQGQRQGQLAGDGQRDGGQRFRGEGRGAERSRGGGRFERSGAAYEPPFDPVVDVLFYPEDTPFKALSHAMRSSCRTYELFEIARLILDKPDRHVIVLKPRADGKGITQLYQSVPDGLPFGSEEEAFAHVLTNHIERFFEVTQEACEPPKGNFLAINRCGLTGKLLGPPNYHLYQQFLLEHHARELPNLPFEKLQARIESVKDEAVTAQWLEQMSIQTRYKLKQPQEGEQELFESLEAVKLFLSARRQNEVVRKVPQVRLSGTLVESLPQGVIRKSLLAALAHQKRFPLESANNLRGRLRRLKFTIYKRKGVSFVCAVKRNFRDEDTHFSESVQGLVAFIEAHPNVLVGQLPGRYLGIELKKAERTALPAREKVPNIEAVPEEEARKIVEAHEIRHHAAAESAAQTAGTESSAASQAVGTESATAPEAVDTEAATVPEAVGVESATAPAANTSATDASEVATPEASASEVATPEASAPEAVASTVAASETDASKAGASEAAVSDPAALESTTSDPVISAPDAISAQTAAGSVSAEPATKGVQLEDPRVRELLNDLRWLIAEGYVTEFGDGRLYASPIVKGAGNPSDEEGDEHGDDADSESTPSKSTEQSTVAEPVTPAKTGRSVKADTPVKADAKTETTEQVAAQPEPATAVETDDAESAKTQEPEIVKESEPETEKEPEAEVETRREPETEIEKESEAEIGQLDRDARSEA